MLTYSALQRLPILSCTSSTNIYWMSTVCHCSECSEGCMGHVAVNQTGRVSALVKLTFSLGETDSKCRDREIENMGDDAKCPIERTPLGGEVCLPVCIGWSGNASLVRGPSSGDLTQKTSPSPWPARSPCLPWPGSDLSPPLSASPLCSRHTGLLAVPQTCQARSYLRTFSLSVPSARKPLPPDLRMARVLTSLRSLLQCPLLREALPNHPAFGGAATPHTTVPLALPCFPS